MNNLLQEEALTQLKKLHLLFVEDDIIIRESMGIILKSFFNQVKTCEDGEKALQYFEKNSVDMIITDIRMPKIDGLDLVKTVRKYNRNIPVIIISSFDDSPTLKRAIPLGLVEYLVKPIDMDDLRKALLKSLDSIEKSNLERTFLNPHCYYNHIEKNVYDTEKNETKTLTANEYKFLELLIAKRGTIVTPDDIESIVYNFNMTSQSLKNLLLRLREKIGDKECIQTLRGIGYKLESL